jgi:hypothetical protein
VPLSQLNREGRAEFPKREAEVRRRSICMVAQTQVPQHRAASEGLGATSSGTEAVTNLENGLSLEAKSGSELHSHGKGTLATQHAGASHLGPMRYQR